MLLLNTLPGPLLRNPGCHETASVLQLVGTAAQGLGFSADQNMMPKAAAFLLDNLS